MSPFVSTCRPYFLDLTDTYIGGKEAWERDRENLSKWLHTNFKNVVATDSPRFWNSLEREIVPELQGNFKRLNDWLGKILFMRPETNKLLWCSIILGSYDLEKDITRAPHTDFPPTLCEEYKPQTDHWNGVRFLLPVDNCESQERSTSWWDLKDRHKYILGSREHINQIRIRTGDFNATKREDGDPSLKWASSKYASNIKEECMDDFECVAVQKLTGPALINTAIPHYVSGAVLKNDDAYRVALTLKPARPELTFSMIMGQTYRGRVLHG